MPIDSTLDKQIYWRTRRGLLELDHVLQRYWQTQKNIMDDASKRAFTSLLDCQDPELLQYLVYRTQDAENHSLQQIVLAIRAYIDRGNR